MAVSEGAILPTVFNSLLGILSRPVAFLSSISFKRVNTNRYSEFAEKTIYQWFPDKVQDLHLQQEYILLVPAHYLESVC